MAKKKTADKKTQEEINAVVEYTYSQKLEMIDNMKKELPAYIEKRKKEFVKQLLEYSNSKEDGEGNMIVESTKIPLFNISEYCFEPFVKVPGVIPDYSASELSVIFDFFKDCIKTMNQETIFPPTKEQFCRLCGFSTSRFSELKNTSTQEVREVLINVEDYLVNYYTIGGLTRRISEVSSIFTQKVLGRKEATENQAPAQTNNIIIGENAFEKLCNQFGVNTQKKE